MPAAHTVFRVRSEQTDLAAGVASVIRPDDLDRARKQAARGRKTGTVRTTFCPICGADKGKTSSRCGSCFRDAMARGHSRLAGAKALVGIAITRDNPSHGDYQPAGLTSSRRVRGEGHVHVQAWDRKILIDGVWVAESQTPEGIERKRTDDDALRRLESIR